MNFFEHQRQAQRNTTYLVFLFSLAIIGIILMTNFAGWFVIEAIRTTDPDTYQAGSFRAPFTWPSPDQYHHFFGITGLTIMVIFLSAVYKKMVMGSKGRDIAGYMGGTDAELLASDSRVKRAQNVLDEMSIAAGMTPPPLFILQSEDSINAFAAGMTPQTSVVAISQGALDTLSRDELQGVMAHELSHIIHGDTRLNIKLLGYLSGIVTIGIIGRIIMRSGTRVRGKDSGGAVLLLLTAGLALFIIGSLGVFVGRMIRAAVSRQREFLADASAVQFTRFPAGIAGALAKIGKASGQLHFAGAEEVGHMCFENPIAPFTFAMNATHPPLEERIARLDKRFLDKNFLKTNLKSPTQRTPDGKSKKKKKTAQDIINSLGSPTPESLAILGSVVNFVRPELDSERPQSPQAKALVMAILNHTGKSEKTEKIIQTYCEKNVLEEFKRFEKQILTMPRSHFLPVLQKQISILRTLGQTEKNVFLKACEYIVKADKHIDLHEASLYFLLEKHLGPESEVDPKFHKTIGRISPSVNLILSALCLHGQDSFEEAKQVHQATMATLGLGSMDFASEISDFTLGNYKTALQNLNSLSFREKERFFKALLQAALFDGEINSSELEFMTATCDSIGIPLPVDVPL